MPPFICWSGSMKNHHSNGTRRMTETLSFYDENKILCESFVRRGGKSLRLGHFEGSLLGFMFNSSCFRGFGC